VQNGLLVGELNPDRLRHVVAVNLCLSFFQRPRDMMKVCPDRLAETVKREKTRTLHQEVFKRAGARFG
jgi:hypothetical protein